MKGKGDKMTAERIKSNADIMASRRESESVATAAPFCRTFDRELFSSIQERKRKTIHTKFSDDTDFVTKNL